MPKKSKADPKLYAQFDFMLLQFLETQAGKKFLNKKDAIVFYNSKQVSDETLYSFFLENMKLNKRRVSGLVSAWRAAEQEFRWDVELLEQICQKIKDLVKEKIQDRALLSKVDQELLPIVVQEMNLDDLKYKDFSRIFIEHFICSNINKAVKQVTSV